LYSHPHDFQTFRTLGVVDASSSFGFWSNDLILVFSSPNLSIVLVDTDFGAEDISSCFEGVDGGILSRECRSVSLWNDVDDGLFGISIISVGFKVWSRECAKASKRMVFVPSGVWRIIEGSEKDMVLVLLLRRIGFGNLVEAIRQREYFSKGVL